MQDDQKINYFAATNSRGKQAPFGIKSKDRARHMYIIGKTGMGKSTMLENMAIQDIRNGEGMAFIDPHGSTADRILEYVPEHRIKDVLYFAPFDMDYPVAFNVMEDVGYDKRHLVVSGLLSAFRKIWVDAWSARMEYILSNTLLALLEYDGSTLLDVNRMLVNKAFRKKVVDNIKDPTVRAFWVEEFANYTDRYTQDATPAIQNKVGQFTSNPLIRNIVGQPKSSFDIRKMMDDKKILIINLSKGRMGEVNATLLGSMLVTKIYLAAMSRADVPAETLAKLPPFYLYVDEFQNFANESFSDILSEARKYKLNLIIAHQYVEQMEEEVRDAVFGNVGTTVTFRVGPFDAETLEKVFEPQFTATDLVNLGFAQIYLTLMIDGVGSTPFSATTLPPFDPPPEKHVDKVIENSRKEFGKPRAEVESAIIKWNEADIDSPAARSAAALKKETGTSAPARATSSAPKAAAPREKPAEVVREVVKETVVVAAPVPVVRQEAPRPKREEPRVPRPEPELPPLGGATSLREALMQVTSHKPQEPAPKPAAPQPSKPKQQSQGTELKDVLHAVAPKAEAKPAASNHTTEDKPVGLPEDVLRSMLAVDETDDEPGDPIERR
ncbi:MAG TPA: type IV secretion system DNA-binding domain-containing protein [Candidatus Paceibacterota bacterium]|nr:type IV secretion system DNA-binding domain-containing protein [Candidatus Paceibacterota bacterium]